MGSSQSIQAEHTMRGHDGWPRGVAVTADGRVGASASEDGTARLWDIARGEKGHVLEGHNAALCDIALSDDGALVATAGRDGTARVWDTAKGTEVFKMHRVGFDEAVGVELSADGARLFVAFSKVTHTGAFKGQIVECDWRSKRMIASWDRPGLVRHLVVSQAADVIAFSWTDSDVVGEENGVEVLSALSGRTMLTRCALSIGKHDGPGIALDHSGSFLVLQDDLSLSVCSVGSHGRGDRILAEYRGHPASFRQPAISPDGHYVVAPECVQKAFGVWKVSTGQRLGTIRGHSEWTYGGAISCVENGNAKIITTSMDSTVRTWNVQEPGVLPPAPRMSVAPQIGASSAAGPSASNNSIVLSRPSASSDMTMFGQEPSSSKDPILVGVPIQGPNVSVREEILLDTPAALKEN